MSKAGREKFKRVADGSVGSGHPTCTDGEDAAEEFERKYGSFRSEYGGSQLYRKYDDGYSSCEDDNLDPPPFLRNITVDKEGVNKYDLGWPSSQPEEEEIFLSESAKDWKVASR